MLTDILLTSLIISLFCCGLYTITQPGKILYFLAHPFENARGWKIELMKPILLCPPCMASVWGLTIYYFLHGWQWQMLICCICSSFINDIFISIKEKFLL